MKNWKKFSRVILFLALLSGVSMPVQKETASAAPMRQASTNVVISEFRTRGTSGASDEFIEIYNPTDILLLLGIGR
jgi:hypothetical protein